jgi:hypothetical protein
MDDKDTAGLAARKNGYLDDECRNNELMHSGVIISEVRKGPSNNQWATASVTDGQYSCHVANIGPRSAHDNKIDKKDNKGISKKNHVQN